MDDELFLADSSPSKPAESFSTSNPARSYSNLFYTGSSKSKTVAFHMLRTAVKKILLKSSSFNKFLKLKFLIRWKFSRPAPVMFVSIESKIKAMVLNFSAVIFISLKKSLHSWARVNKTFNLSKKHEFSKSRREEVHLQQKAQMNKALTQILNKQAELEKNIATLTAKEKGYKEAIEELNRIPPQDNQENARLQVLLKELENENQMLRDKLEAVENNVAGFIKEMSELLEEDERFAPSDDDGLGDSQGKVVRKKRSNLLR
jgi:hypothetical protein